MIDVGPAPNCVSWVDGADDQSASQFGFDMTIERTGVGVA
jgi:hypothetical protein